jgi:peptidase C39-like protein
MRTDSQEETAVDRRPALVTVTPRDISFRRWTDAAGFAAGTGAGVAVTGDGLVIAGPVGTLDHTDPYGSGAAVRYEYATWLSPVVAPGFGFTELVTSWHAETPGGCWIGIDMRAETGSGRTGWYVMGRWAADDELFHRTTVGGQRDAAGRVDADIFRAADGVRLTSWQLRLTLYRPAGGTDTPSLASVGAMVSAPLTAGPAASSPGPATGTVLDVPGYSQRIHAGQYPQWNGGGATWCSATSTAMILAYWGTGPAPDEYAWVDPSYADPWVDHAARHTFDYQYDGCGNWSFNTAYAGRYGLDGFVTRLRSLAEAESFIAAGIPLVLSLSFGGDQIPGLAYSTSGHLLVLVGFDAAGDPVLNDPNSDDDASVRKPVPRADFERAWLSSSGGTTYVMRPAGTPLPTPPDQPNW